MDVSFAQGLYVVCSGLLGCVVVWSVQKRVSKKKSGVHEELRESGG